MVRAAEEDIESIIRATIAAINARDFDPSSPAWAHIAAEYRVQLDSHEPPRISSREHVCPSLAALCAAHPQYQICIVDMHATVKSRSDRATVLANVEIEGFPEGVRYESIFCWELEFAEGRWWMARMLGQRGMNLG